MAHTFDPNTWGNRQVDLCEFKASLVYTKSSRTSKVIQRNPVREVGEGRHKEGRERERERER